jgi:hypothetical protein
MKQTLLRSFLDGPSAKIRKQFSFALRSRKNGNICSYDVIINHIRLQCSSKLCTKLYFIFCFIRFFDRIRVALFVNRP